MKLTVAVRNSLMVPVAHRYTKSNIPPTCVRGNSKSNPCLIIAGRGCGLYNGEEGKHGIETGWVVLFELKFLGTLYVNLMVVDKYPCGTRILLLLCGFKGAAVKLSLGFELGR